MEALFESYETINSGLGQQTMPLTEARQLMGKIFLELEIDSPERTEEQEPGEDSEDGTEPKMVTIPATDYSGQ